MKLLATGFFLLILLNSCGIPFPTAGTQARQNTQSTTQPGNAFQQEFLQRINTIRSKGCNCGNTFMPPVPSLTWNTQLETAAFLHARDMNRQKYFSHVSKSGRTSKDRIMNAGYTIKGFSHYAVGENIAWGQRSIKEVMEGWLKSEGHCRNLMNASFREVGISMENYYWVQDFGGRR
ncbi:CAP domain-containing protein [Pararcticibacter amylolyticus]|uniref:CAP domain-containing protein n=1 Tax=Pararcticibacter amylolyticus TaxID=2173175 RepID=A0A2U2PJS6_9SPHI|nr:CAP domain-containing protein [Pararcticibacter amylolyticus]PWG81651.1 CAP domain-containing protein [Pararcticibacter amylolyticus]